MNFSAPMRRCATTLEAEMTVEEHRLLLEVLRTDHGNGTHLEIGTAAGGTLCIMLGAFPTTSRPRFVVVDTMRYFPSQLEVVRQNLEQHGFASEPIDIRVSQSVDAFAQAEANQESFDFVLIDGSHKIRAVTADLKWTRLVRPGGIICLHDYSSNYPGVKLAVNRFLSRNRNYTRIGLAGSLLVLRKTAMAKCKESDRSDEIYAHALHPIINLIAKWTRKKVPDDGGAR